MRNITEIHFSDTTGNGKFSGKPDLPVEIFFLVSDSCPMSGEILTVRTTRVVPWRAVHRNSNLTVRATICSICTMCEKIYHFCYLLPAVSSRTATALPTGNGVRHRWRSTRAFAPTAVPSAVRLRKLPRALWSFSVSRSKTVNRDACLCPKLRACALGGEQG